MTDRNTLIRTAQLLREQFIPYERAERVEKSIHMAHHRENAASEGGVVTLFGASRSGKTKILSDYAARYPTVMNDIQKENGEFADRMEVITISVPDGNPKNFFEKMYATLLGISVEQVKSLHKRRFDFAETLKELGQEVGLKLIIVTEAHQVLKQSRAAEDMAQLLKDLTNARCFSMVISGTAKAERLIEVSEELRGRVLVQHHLEPFKWSNPEDQDMFSLVLDGLDNYLCENVFRKLSNLSARRVAEPLLEASKGYIGHAATLIEMASIRAIDDMLAGRGRGITLEHLGYAFSESPLSNGYEPNEVPLPTPKRAARVGGDWVDESEMNPTTRIRGRTRRTHRDVDFRN